MSNISWTPEEEADLLASLSADGLHTKEAYREFIGRNPTNRRRTFEAWRCKAKALLRERELAADGDGESSDRAIWQDQRAIILRENQRLKAENTQLKATNALIVEAMEETVARLPRFDPPKPHAVKTARRRPQVGMLDISDVHGGEVVRPEDVAGLGCYDFELCKQRMDMMAHAVLTICDIYQNAGIGINKLVLNFLGDVVTNEDIYVGQGRDIDRILVDQIFQLAHELCTRMIYPFCQYFPQVEANCVWGNHGRMGKAGEYHKRTNADYILYHAMRLMMAHVQHFNIRISLSSFMGYVLPEDPKRPHLIAHGDKIRRYLSIPYYGMDRWDARMVSLTQVAWAFVHLGHHHRAAVIDAPHGERIMNGSWVGASDFSVDVLQEGGQPKQKFMGLHPEWGKTWSYDIYLDKERPRLQPGEDGLYTPIWEQDKDTALR